MDREREAKPAWSAVPRPLKMAAERLLDAKVARADRVYGGYAPSATYRLTLADGRRVFFKGSYPLPAGSAVVWQLDREARVYRALGDLIRPWAPAYLGSVRAEGWRGVLLEMAGGTALLPWTPAKARRALRSYAGFHAVTVGRELPRWLSRTDHRRFRVFWRAIASDADRQDRLAGAAGPRRDEAREWLGSHLGALVRAERVTRIARDRYALLHADTRSDNLRLDGSLLRIFDWPAACVGPPEFDVAVFLQSIEAEGGPRCETTLGWYEAELPLRYDELTACIAGIAGYFADRAPRPPVPGLPRLRSIQRRQLKASLRWVAGLLDLPPPDWLASIEP